jgi:hypothetical protein
MAKTVQRATKGGETVYLPDAISLQIVGEALWYSRVLT